MNDTTLNKIKVYLKQSEGEPEHPYLDLKGNVTIGVGFKSNNANDFANLNLQVFKEGRWVTATGDEKRQAFRQMQEAKEKRNGDFSPNAGFYKDKTNIRMTPKSQEAELDKRISDKVNGIKDAVGEDAWNKLNDDQKAAVMDIVYANGPIRKFPNLRDAIQEGNARKMADESTFYTDSTKGLRAMDRLQRNYEALSGLSREEAATRLQEVLKKNDSARKNTPSNKPEPTEKPGASGGEGQKQSSLLPDPDAGSGTNDFTPEQNSLLKDFDKTDGPLDEILAKDPSDFTEIEFLELKKAMIDLPSGPEQERLDGMAKAFLEDKFGTGPAEYDAVGRMIDPEPKKPINKDPVPAKTPDGEPLSGALKRIGKAVASAAGNGSGGGEGSASAVQGLQSGLNILKQVMGRDGNQRRAPSPDIVADLKTDGIVGPKTRRALRIATSRLGRTKIEEGFALGRFGRFARDVQVGRDDTCKLGATISKAFGPLFRPLGTALPKQGRGENLAFQATLNDLGPKVFEPDAFKPIREDGLIGPRTETAFNAVLPAAGPDRFTLRFGHNLGFFDFDDFG